MPIPSRSLLVAVLGVLGLLALAPTAHAPRAVRAQSVEDDPFAVPVGLERAVEFWKKVYGEWSEHEVTFHDRDDLGIVYRTMHQRKSETPTEYRANEAAQEAQRAGRLGAHLREKANRNDGPSVITEQTRIVSQWTGPVDIKKSSAGVYVLMFKGGSRGAYDARPIVAELRPKLVEPPVDPALNPRPGE